MIITPLKENFPDLTAIEILQKIGNKKIGGLWLRKTHVEKAIKCKEITKGEAVKILAEFDADRRADYNYWKMFN